ncbi:LamG-like jellyroll fold domain-containing protein [Candidatus Methanoperedens nitratireducens]|uniref:LamG-like jellyroll fold domain-containing protein n=1 Tax=Candidatus Methanoperedens nitratireducens TaxID=1392998 RepID=UPI0015CB0A3E|nr:LamG-like jellyroll fold domain-containing protein [Candidatus Methanoperedens nitroreducens]
MTNPSWKRYAIVVEPETPASYNGGYIIWGTWQNRYHDGYMSFYSPSGWSGYGSSTEDMLFIFTYTWDNSVLSPSYPVKVSPVDGSTNVGYKLDYEQENATVGFSWNAVTDLDGDNPVHYYVKANRDESGIFVKLPECSGVTGLSCQASGFNFDEYYQWQIYAVDNWCYTHCVNVTSPLTSFNTGIETYATFTSDPNGTHRVHNVGQGTEIYRSYQIRNYTVGGYYTLKLIAPNSSVVNVTYMNGDSYKGSHLWQISNSSIGVWTSELASCNSGYINCVLLAQTTVNIIEGLSIEFIDPTPDDGVVLPYASNVTIATYSVGVLNRSSSIIDFDDDLSAWYKFNLDTTDSSGNHNDVSWVGTPGYGDGMFGNGITLDGSNHVTVASNYNILFDNAFSVDAWVKFDNTTGVQAIVSKGRSGPTGWGFNLVKGSGQYFRFYFYDDNATRHYLDFGSVTAGVWYHPVVTYDGTLVRSYLNGTFVNSMAVEGFTPSIDNLTIGRYSYSDTWYVNGTIDDVKLWNRALSEYEVAASDDARVVNQIENAFYDLDPGIYEYTGYLQDETGLEVNTGTRSFDIPQNYLPGDPWGMGVDVLADYINFSWHEGAPYVTRYNGTYGITEVPDVDNLSVTSSGLTISLWVRPDVVDFGNCTVSGDKIVNGTLLPNEGCYLMYAGKMGTNENEYGFRIYNKSGGTRPNRMSFYLFNLVGGLGVGSYVQDPIVPGEWMNIVGKVDSNKTYLYKNGKLRDSDVYDGSTGKLVITPGNGNAPFRLGSADLKGEFEGAIEDLNIWNRSLTDEEIKLVYEGLLPDSGHIYSFSSQTDNTLELNESISGVNGILKGNVTWDHGRGYNSTDSFDVIEQGIVAGNYVNETYSGYDYTNYLEQDLIVGDFINLAVWGYNSSFLGTRSVHSVSMSASSMGYDPSGYVNDTAGNPVWRASVKISNVTYSDLVYTDAAGLYNATIYESGDYMYDISADGFTSISGTQHFDVGGVNNNFTLTSTMGRVYGTVFEYTEQDNTQAISGNLNRMRQVLDNGGHLWKIFLGGTMAASLALEPIDGREYVIKLQDLDISGNPARLRLLENGNVVADEIVYKGGKLRYLSSETSEVRTYFDVNVVNTFSSNSGEIQFVEVSIGYTTENVCGLGCFMWGFVEYWVKYFSSVPANLRAFVDFENWLLQGPNNGGATVTFNCSQGGNYFSDEIFDFSNTSNMNTVYANLNIYRSSCNGVVSYGFSDDLDQYGDDWRKEPGWLDFNIAGVDTGKGQMLVGKDRNFIDVDRNGNKKIKLWLWFHATGNGEFAFNHYVTVTCAGTGCNLKPLPGALVYYNSAYNVETGVDGTYSMFVPLESGVNISYSKENYEIKYVNLTFNSSYRTFVQDMVINSTNVTPIVLNYSIKVTPDPSYYGSPPIINYKLLHDYFNYRIAIYPFGVDEPVDVYGSESKVIPDWQGSILMRQLRIGTYNAVIEGTSFCVPLTDLCIGWTPKLSDTFVIDSSDPTVSWTSELYYMNQTMHLVVTVPSGSQNITVKYPNGSVLPSYPVTQSQTSAPVDYLFDTSSATYPPGRYIANISGGNTAIAELSPISDNGYNLSAPSSVNWGSSFVVKYVSPASTQLIVYDSNGIALGRSVSVKDTGSVNISTSNFPEKEQILKISLVDRGGDAKVSINVVLKVSATGGFGEGEVEGDFFYNFKSLIYAWFGSSPATLGAVAMAIMALCAFVLFKAIPHPIFGMVGALMGLWIDVSASLLPMSYAVVIGILAAGTFAAMLKKG